MLKAYKFGIELEILVNRDNWPTIQRKITEARLPYEWKGDGSVRSDTSDYTGVEIVASHPLGFTELERSSKALCKILNFYDSKVNTTTGYHVHISNKRFFNAKNIKRLLYVWCSLEDFMLATQPRSRYNNQYCRRALQRFITDTGDNLPKAKRELVSHLGSTDRYYTLNLASMARHGTIECRLHSGTTDSKKVLAWVELLLAIYNYTFEKYNHADITALFNMSISDEKIAKIYQVLGLDEKLQEHFTARIQRFGFELLKTHQEGAIKALALKPELDKKRKAYERARRAYTRLDNEAELARQAFNTTSF